MTATPASRTEVRDQRTAAATMLNKVPAVTVFFWIIKVMGTTVGETAADYLNETLKFGLNKTSIVVAVALAIVLTFQFRSRRYIPAIYWTAVVLISIAGTLMTDNLTDGHGISTTVTTPSFGIALAIVFGAWFWSERSLSIHTIVTTRREAFYWLTILFTFAFGTSAGDLIAEKINLGYWKSGLMFAALIALVAVAHYVFKLGEIAAFWMAYILTRPLGASLGDYLSQKPGDGGLGLGTTGTTVLFLAIILALVIFLSLTKRDLEAAHEREDDNAAAHLAALEAVDPEHHHRPLP